MATVTFRFGNQSTYDALKETGYDSNSLYFIEDTQRLYKGSILISEQVIFTETVPEFGSAIKDRIYAVTQDNTTRLYVKGATEMTEIGGASATHIVEMKEDLGSLDHAEVGEQAFVKSGEDPGMYVLTKLPASDQKNWSKINSDTSWTDGKKINFEKVSTFEAYNSSEKNTDTLYFYNENGIGKIFRGDLDVTSSVVLVDEIETSVTTEKCLPNILYVDKETFVCKVYDGKTLHTIFPGYITDGNNWAQVDDDSKLATVKAIKDALNDKIKDKVTIVEGTEDDIVLFGSSGAIKDSNKKIGGTTVAKDGNENIVATEAAVIDLLTWKEIKN